MIGRFMDGAELAQALDRGMLKQVLSNGVHECHEELLPES
jgi:hypothetical protein